jgi:UDP-N-acetylmuramate--alanine ligase
MYREFAEVLETYADHTVMLDVYGAREDRCPA